MTEYPTAITKYTGSVNVQKPSVEREREREGEREDWKIIAVSNACVYASPCRLFTVTSISRNVERGWVEGEREKLEWQTCIGFLIIFATVVNEVVRCYRPRSSIWCAREDREINGLINYRHGGEEFVGSIVSNFL